LAANELSCFFAFAICSEMMKLNSYDVLPGQKNRHQFVFI
jgi:hypothetical protein